MKVQFKINAKVVVEAEGDTPKAVFANLAALADVLACADKCGACQSAEVIPQVREPKGFVYYELQCRACGATLTLGQNKEGGGLFPKRTNEDGSVKQDGGWEVYQGGQKGYAAPAVGRGRPAGQPQRREEIPY